MASGAGGLGTIEEDEHAAWDLDAALTEVVDTESPEYEQCRYYVRELEGKLGSSRAQHFLQEFGKILPLVSEANEITREVRPKDRLRLSLEVMSDIFTYETDEPELVVRLWKGSTGVAATVTGLALV